MNPQKQRYVTVALLRKMPRSLGVLTYAVPSGIPTPKRGTWVAVPFRAHSLRAVIWDSLTTGSISGKTALPFTDVLPLDTLTTTQCELVSWLADTYGVSISHALTTLLPVIPDRAAVRDLPARLPPPPSITIERSRADELRRAANVPLSGTTVFTVGALRDQIVLLASLLAADDTGQTLVVMPTHAMLDMVRSSMPSSSRAHILLDPDASTADFWSTWSSVRTKKDAIVFTTRKGCGAPFQRLHSIVVLNWSDPVLHHSERNPRYDARALLTTLAELAQARLTILDAVVPFDLAGACTVQRVAPRAPNRTVLSLRDDRRAGNKTPLTETAIKVLRTTHGPHLVFLNRRGTTRQLSCPDCGWILSCPRDVLPMVEHEQGIFHCHVCGTLNPEPHRCPNCKNAKLIRRGKGTQTLERFLRTTMPERSIVRVDKDTAFRPLHADIVVATEKIFTTQPRTLFRNCIIVSVESEADLPGYAAVEHAYALFERVACLCTLDGRLLIQTWRTDAPLVDALRRNGAGTFYEKERAVRAMLKLPPAATVVKAFFAAESETSVRHAATEALPAVRVATVDTAWTLEGPYVRTRRGKRGHEASFLLRCLSGASSRGTLRTIFHALPDDWLCEVNPSALFSS